MPETAEVEKKTIKGAKEMRLFKKLTAIPYLLVIFALMMPFANVSCSEDVVVAEPTLYQVAAGLDLEQELKEPAVGIMKKMESGNPTAMESMIMTNVIPKKSTR